MEKRGGKFIYQKTGVQKLAFREKMRHVFEPFFAFEVSLSNTLRAVTIFWRCG